MKVTKYPQSCVLLEKEDGGRVLIDPGQPASAVHEASDFGPVDAVLYTHSHRDHLDRRLLAALTDSGAQVYANADTKTAIREADVTVVHDGDRLSIAGFDVTVHDLSHMPMVDGSPGPPNTGYVFDSSCFHPGDGFQIAGLTVDTLFVPIAGPSMSFRDAYRFVAEVAARRVIPMHFDVFAASPAMFADRCDIAETIVLLQGESVELQPATWTERPHG